ncbi:MAG: hypothetical protein PHF76_06265 [Bacteroidales bacterium]|jgi:hypothetical protein|nr:hypothetical protein [Bacteroidales bacterium]
MFEYVKTVLGKVAFSKELFRSELLKSDRWLTAREQEYLSLWCMTNYSDIYPDVIEEYKSKIKSYKN